MSETSFSRASQMSLSRLRRLDTVCDEHEAAWARGERPHLGLCGRREEQRRVPREEREQREAPGHDEEGAEISDLANQR